MWGKHLECLYHNMSSQFHWVNLGFGASKANRALLMVVFNRHSHHILLLDMYTKKESDFTSNYHLQPIFKEDQTLNYIYIRVEIPKWLAICKILPKLCSLLVHSTLLKHVKTYENMFDSYPLSHGLLPPVPFHISFLGSQIGALSATWISSRPGCSLGTHDALMVKQLNTWWLQNFGKTSTLSQHLF